ncbi:MAG: aconitase family protein, partial [Clostridia bacterium]
TLDLCDKIIEGKLHVEQGIIAGCAGGTFENIMEASRIIGENNIGMGEYTLSVYPSSLQVYSALSKTDALTKLINQGAIIKTAFCGPCFGAGDVPSNKAFSIRHTTRNFPSREGSKPNQNQIASVALMDARSIAATSKNQGVLTAATEVEYDNVVPTYYFEKAIYGNRIYDGFGKADETAELKFAPNIQPWPEQKPLGNNVLIKLAAVINDDVTTTDELIPSGETSSYRSNPLKLAEFTLSRKDPKYVERAKAVADLSKNQTEELQNVLKLIDKNLSEVQISSAIFANKPGDGSAREQAASCQRVLGGGANIAKEYATKRYRSNLINWGMLPLRTKENVFDVGDYIYIENVRAIVENSQNEFVGKLIKNGKISDLNLILDDLTADEKQIILAGCLMNYYNI